MGCTQAKQNNNQQPKIQQKKLSNRSNKYKVGKNSDNFSINQQQSSNNSKGKSNSSNKCLEGQQKNKDSNIISNDKPNKIKTTSYKQNQKVIENPEQNMIYIPFPNKKGAANMGKNDTHFNDQQTLDKKQGNFQKIQAIKIQFSEKTIDGIQIAYELTDGNIVTGGDNVLKQQKQQNISSSERINSDSTNFCSEEVFEIPVDDYLVEIKGRSTSENLNQLQFITYKGEYSQIFGASDENIGEPFQIRKKGHTFGPIQGSLTNNNQIQTLSVSTIPLPSDFSEQMGKQSIDV